MATEVTPDPCALCKEGRELTTDPNGERYHVLYGFMREDCPDHLSEEQKGTMRECAACVNAWLQREEEQEMLVAVKAKEALREAVEAILREHGLI